jgi:hypothetical protein
MDTRIEAIRPITRPHAPEKGPGVRIALPVSHACHAPESVLFDPRFDPWSLDPIRGATAYC